MRKKVKRQLFPPLGKIDKNNASLSGVETPKVRYFLRDLPADPVQVYTVLVVPKKDVPLLGITADGPRPIPILRGTLDFGSSLCSTATATAEVFAPDSSVFVIQQLPSPLLGCEISDGYLLV